MPFESRASVPVTLRRVGEWVLAEELYKWGSWEDNNRGVLVPDGASVTMRHNMQWPPWHWEIGLGPGEHTFYLPDGWNKFQLRLDSPRGSTVVCDWIL